MLGSAESELVRLISREIIFAEFQRSLMISDNDSSTSQTDGRTTFLGNTALR